jgi:hypothetical protein
MSISLEHKDGGQEVWRVAKQGHTYHIFRASLSDSWHVVRAKQSVYKHQNFERALDTTIDLIKSSITNSL